MVIEDDDEGWLTSPTFVEQQRQTFVHTVLASDHAINLFHQQTIWKLRILRHFEVKARSLKGRHWDGRMIVEGERHYHRRGYGRRHERHENDGGFLTIDEAPNYCCGGLCAITRKRR